jgi:hypothetical protein
MLHQTTPLPRSTEWNLDKLGNWTGHFSGQTQTEPGRHIEGDVAGNGVNAVEDTSHNTDFFNQIDTIATSTGGSPVTRQIVYDKSGNLISDGTCFFQYDGLNRLVKVNLLGQLVLDPIPA